MSYSMQLVARGWQEEADKSASASGELQVEWEYGTKQARVGGLQVSGKVKGLGKW